MWEIKIFRIFFPCLYRQRHRAHRRSQKVGGDQNWSPAESFKKYLFCIIFPTSYYRWFLPVDCEHYEQVGWHLNRDPQGHVQEHVALQVHAVQDQALGGIKT